MCHLCPYVSKCCWRCSLRTGALTIGWLYLTLTVVITIGSLVVIIVVSDSDILDNCRDQCKKREGLEYNKCVDKCSKDLKTSVKTLRYCVGTVIVMSVLSAVLLAGVYLVVPVLLVVFVYGIPAAYLVNNVVSLTVLGTEGVSVGDTVRAVVVILFCWLLQAYICMVVYSLYRTMVSPEEYPTEEAVAVVVVVYAGPLDGPQQGGAGPNYLSTSPQADAAVEPTSPQKGWRRG